MQKKREYISAIRWLFPGTGPDRVGYTPLIAGNPVSSSAVYRLGLNKRTIAGCPRKDGQ